jgi:hypothetical protein
LTLLSGYTKNPTNLAINAPTGEGKTYVVTKVADLFPQSDIMFLSAMTDKALFHRQGVLVIKNERGEAYLCFLSTSSSENSDAEPEESGNNQSLL